MTDDTTTPPVPTVPVQAPAVAPSVDQVIEAKVEKTFSTTVSGLWAKYNILFIIVGLALIAAKFGNVIIDVLSWSSKKDIQDAQKTDSALKTQEDAANKQADDLVKQADELPKQEGTVSDDWYKNSK